MSEKKILHLTLTRKWFDLIASGMKMAEYREIKPYWNKRLLGKVFDEVHFRNGYNPKSPFMRVEFKGLFKGLFQGKVHHQIILGEVLELRNYVQDKRNGSPKPFFANKCWGTHENVPAYKFVGDIK